MLTFDEASLRIGGALATLAVGGGLALLTTTRARELLQAATLGVVAIAAVQFGWSLMDPLGTLPHEELRRAIRMMAMLGATTFVYALPLVRLVAPESSWFASIRRAAIGVAVTTISILALVLVFEISAFDPTVGTPVTVGESLLVASTLALLAAGLDFLGRAAGSRSVFPSGATAFPLRLRGRSRLRAVVCPRLLDEPRVLPAPAAALLAARRDGHRLRRSRGLGAVPAAQNQRAVRAARIQCGVSARAAGRRILVYGL